MRRITAEDLSRRMPPVYSKIELTDRERATLRDWIQQGAPWEKHWSFLPPQRPEIPQTTLRSWVRNPIDSFILARLEQEGLRPSAEADQVTLARRVSLDLTGTPPTPTEVDAYVGDRSPGAYEKFVDRLLASPRYGERMALPWLAAARYADTNGYQYDGERQMWRWRDWVIDAFNRNQPFDRFVVEQLAGDLLPNATLSQRIATGFNRNHRINTEFGIIGEEYLAEYVADRVETAGTVFLGLTLGCARCHDHKYDPITQKEFYQLAAYFNSIPDRGRGMLEMNTPPVVSAPTPEQTRRLDELNQGIEAVQSWFRSREQAIRREEGAWEQGLRSDSLDHWAPSRGLVRHVSFDDELPDSSIPLVAGRIGRAGSFDGKTVFDAGQTPLFDMADPFTVAAWIRPEDEPRGAILGRKVDTPKGAGYGVLLDEHGINFHFVRIWPDAAIQVRTDVEPLAAGRWHHVAVTYAGTAAADDVRIYLNGRQARTRVENDTLTLPLRRVGTNLDKPLQLASGWGPDKRFRGTIDEVRVYSRKLSPLEIEALAVGATVAETADKLESERSTAEARNLRWHFLEHGASAGFAEKWKHLASLEAERELLERDIPSVMVMAELPEPRDTFVLLRGAYDAPGEKVSRGVPAVLPPPPANLPGNRLGLAKWLVEPGNPLLARVTVNRFWQQYFGTGLVKTSEDFGAQGEWPSHPELLDWLATEFIRTGWEVKAMQRLIVTSATYRQSSRVTPDLVHRDPENRLLARAPRLRLPAEIIRDQALFASGLLVERIGGPSVKGYQPPGLWKELTMSGLDYQQDKGPSLYRRGLYSFWKRTVPPPMLSNFDAAHRETCVVRDHRTNTPLQALNMMNDVAFMEVARFLGQRMLREAGADPSARIRYGFRLVLARLPTAGEEQTLRDSLQYHLDYFAGDESRVEQYLAQGEGPLNSALDARDMAAYMAVASLILNMDAALSRN